ncbi:2Fe-2S iron-sulfur cluster-binding protein [Streptomyces sp. NPDC001941]|uniref:(2Fe-2S)-binding protein n=1 Tax=Streptomyces sp. NPDC001941 TaxID=3154659 RepID=UPI003328CF8B
MLRMRVNGTDRDLEVDVRVSLLDALRDHLGLTGAKKGCDQGACGACTVLLDGERVLGCLELAVRCDGRDVTTVEGLAGHPLRDALVRHDGLQCGFCTSGQLCSAVALLAEAQRDRCHVTYDMVREGMSGNLCRCGAYNGIAAAIGEVAGAEAFGGAGAPAGSAATAGAAGR